MKPKQSKPSVWQRFIKHYTVQFIEDKWLLPVRTFRTSFMKLSLWLATVIIVALIAGALLATQTRLLQHMGSRPRNIMSQDYSTMKARLDSLGRLSDQRDQQLARLEAFITEGIYDQPAKDSQVVQEVTTSQLTTFAIPPNCCFVRPVEGELTGEFKPDLNHYGLDIAAPLNTPIHAIGQGYVVFAGYHRLYGNSVIIEHPNGIQSHYLHNSRLLVITGQYVTRAQPIAIIGNTGEFTTGPHLHFELWINGRQIDPRPYLQLKK